MPTTGGATTVLLVDDDADVANVTRMHLERQDDEFEVVVENSAADALDGLDDSVDCIVSDYEMPNLDGLELLREVRQHDRALPFILFTGRGSEEIASEAISAGVTDYLQKGTGTDQYAVLANRVQNAVEHQRSVAAAVESETRYRSLVDSSPNAVLIHDGEEIQYVNERGLELVGASTPDDVLGRDPLSFVHPADREDIAERIETVFGAGSSIDWHEFRLERLDGEVRYVESRAAQVAYDGSQASQAVLRDVTERNRRERRLEALHEATRRLLTVDDRETVGEITIDALAHIFDEPVSAVWEYDPEQHVLTPLAASENATRVALDAGFDPGISPLPEWSVEMAAYEAGEPRVVDDYASREDVVTDAFESAFLQPLGEYGLLAIASQEKREFDASDRDLIGILARSVVATFDRLGEEST